MAQFESLDSLEFQGMIKTDPDHIVAPSTMQFTTPNTNTNDERSRNNNGNGGGEGQLTIVMSNETN